MLAMEWLMAESTKEKAGRNGMPVEGNGAYAIGRLGVLGDCPIDNVVGAAFFWEPETMRAMVASGRSAMSPMEGAAIYTQICQEWGTDKLAGMESVERLGELCERVVDNASPLGVPTFVGWRDQARTEPGPAHAMQMAQCMRELRFGRHAIAVQAAGMAPLEAILSGPAGEWNAKFFGWSTPYPDVDDLAEARNAIEATTDQLHAVDLDLLTDNERAELRTLAKAARGHASPPARPGT
jgi:hypothetical protein